MNIPMAIFANWRNRLALSIVAVISLLVFFLILFFGNNIKAQTASIISEDGNGILGISTLMNATMSGDVESVKFFSKAGVDVVNQKNVGGATALHIASRTGNVEIAKILIDSGANINAADNEGWTPLMRAAMAKSPELVKFLLNSGADASKANSFGETVIIHATASECNECLEQIFSRYNFLEHLDTGTLNNQINTAINMADKKNSKELQSIFKDYKDQELARDYNLIHNNNLSGSNVVVKSLDDKGSAKGVVSNKNQHYKFNNSSTQENSTGNPAQENPTQNQHIPLNNQPNNPTKTYRFIKQPKNIAKDVKDNGGASNEVVVKNYDLNQEKYSGNNKQQYIPHKTYRFMGHKSSEKLLPVQPPSVQGVMPIQGSMMKQGSVQGGSSASIPVQDSTASKSGIVNGSTTSTPSNSTPTNSTVGKKFIFTGSSSKTQSSTVVPSQNTQNNNNNNNTLPDLSPNKNNMPITPAPASSNDVHYKFLGGTSSSRVN